MVALATDKLLKVGNPGSATTLSSPGYTIGATSITVGSTSNWPTDTGVVFAIDEAEVVNGVEVQVAGTYNEYIGTVASGTSITNVDWALGSGDRNYASGALTRVYIPVSAERENRIVEWGLVHADQDGTLKAGAVDNAAVLAIDVVETAKIKDGAVSTAKLADASVTPAKLSAFPKFSAYRTADQTVANADTVIFTTEDYDVGGEYNTSTGIFTASVTGTYTFTWKLQTSTATVLLTGLVYGPSNIIKRGSWNGQGPYISSEGSCDIHLDAGHTARVEMIDIQGATKTIDGNIQACYFMGRMVP